MMIDKLKSITIIFALTIMLCSLAYGATTPINKTAAVLHSTVPAASTEQYELTINTDDKVTETHVELLPDDNGKYWIPKGYKVKVTADCEDGYMQNTGTETYTLDEAKTVNVGTEVAPPTKVDLLEKRVAVLESSYVPQIDTDNVLTTYTGGGVPTQGTDRWIYTTTEDCYVTGYITSTGSCEAYVCVYFNDKIIAQYASENSATHLSVYPDQYDNDFNGIYVFAPKGSKIVLRDGWCASQATEATGYSLVIYGCKKVGN